MTPYPAVGFYFTVRVVGSGATLQSQTGADASFQEVSGLEAQRDVESVKAGGVNEYTLQLPGVTKSPNLVLRRGYVSAASFLSEWAAQTVGSDLSQPILTQGLIVQLLGPNRETLVSWRVSAAWPVRWVTGPLDSMKNEVLTEVLEFACATVTRMPQSEARSMVGLVSALIG